MGRVLRLACGLMGVVVLLTTAGMAWERRDDSAWMLVWNTGRGSQQQLVLIDPNSVLQIPLTRFYSELQVHSYAGGTGWLYYTANDYSLGTGGLYRMRVDTLSEPQLIIPNPYITHVSLSHDEQWIIYSVLREVSHPKWEVTLFRARADGRDILQLTDTFANNAAFEADHSALYFSEDDAWIIFNGTYSEDRSDNTVFRIRLDGTGAEKVIEGSLAPILPLRAARDSSWVIITAIDGSLYRYDAERNPPITLLQKPSSDQSWLGFRGWLPKSEIVVLSVPSPTEVEGNTIGVRPSGEVVWTLEGGVDYSAPPDESWIFVGSRKGIQRIRPDGSEAELILDASQGVPNKMIVSDEWLIVELLNLSTEVSTFYRMPVDGETFQKIGEDPPDSHINLQSWLPDKDYLIFYDNSRGLIYRTNLDGSHSKILTAGLYEPYFETWLPPIDRGWTPSHLGIIGAGLIAIFIIRPKKWWSKTH